MRAPVRVTKSRTVFEGKIIRVRVARVVEPGNVRAVREVVEHRGSIVVLPRLADGRIVLVRQYRFAARMPLWELVAGSIEPGEDIHEAARRELLEETGYRAERVTPLIDYFSSPGFLTERMYVVEARGLTRSKAHPEADERIRVGRFTLSQSRRMIRTGKIRDGKTLVSLLWILSGLGRSRQTR